MNMADIASLAIDESQLPCDRHNVPAEDAGDVEKHDMRFHRGGFDPRTMRCSLREKVSNDDESDDRTFRGVMPEGVSVTIGDITKQDTDAIVNAANKYMLGGGGVDGAIHRAAGPQLLEECRKYPEDENGYRVLTGEAKITGSGNLPCKKVIHTAGPDLGALYGKDLDADEEVRTGKLLRSSYRNSLMLAKENGLKSVAFPSISTGIFGYPVDKAARYAAEEITKFKREHPDMEVKMCIFDPSEEKSRELVSAYEKALKTANEKYGLAGEAQDADDVSIPGGNDSSPTNLQKHDAKYHPNGYKEGDNCKYRDDPEKGDQTDVLDPENVEGKEVQSGEESSSALVKAVQDAAADVDSALKVQPIDFAVLQKALDSYENAYDAATGGKGASIIKNLMAGLQNPNGVMAAIYKRQIASLRQASAANSLPSGTRSPQELRNDAAVSLAKALGASLEVPNLYSAQTTGQQPAQSVQSSVQQSIPQPAQQQAPQPTQFGPRPALDITASGFPSASQFNFSTFGKAANGWSDPDETGGSTKPSSITINGQKFWVKKAGYNSQYTNNAAANEVAANRFVRLAGFNAPESKLYTENGVNYCVTKDTPYTGVANSTNSSVEMREAYPLMSLLYSTDAMMNGNTKIDQNGMVFLDNGSSFGFSAQGRRPNTNIGWDYDSRIDPDSTKNEDSGIMALMEHKDQYEWRNAFGNPTQNDVLKEAAKYDMGALIKEASKQGLLSHLPQKGQSAIQQFADNLDILSSKFKTNASPVQSGATSSSAIVQPQPQQQSAVSQGTASAVPSATTQSAPSVQATPSASSQVGGAQWKISPLLANNWAHTLVNSSWLGPNPRVSKNAMGIMTALTSLAGNSSRPVTSALISILKNGTFTPNARGVGGVVTGANLPRKGIVALQKTFNQALNPNGYQMNVHNNGVITFSAPRTVTLRAYAPNVSMSQASQGSQTPASVPSAATHSSPASAKAASFLQAMQQNNPAMASLYQKAMSKMTGQTVQPASSTAQTSSVSTVNPHPVQTPTPSPASTPAQTGNYTHKGLQHLATLIKNNPNLAQTYQSAINKLNAAGIN